MLRTLGALLAAGVVLAVYLIVLSRNLPSLEQLENYDPDLVSRIYSSDGVLLEELFTERRVYVPLDQIPELLVNATVASEDHRFYDHWGISVRDALRAVVVNTVSMRFRQGFSSLTQQLARNLYDTIGFEKTINRKVKEVLTAIQIERTYTKEEILEMYLNSVHFGHGTYGVQAAAMKYFQKPVWDLQAHEAAVLVGVLPAPAHYSPVNHSERALARRNIVLSLMREHDYLTEAAHRQAEAMPLGTVSDRAAEGLAPYFSEYVRRLLEQEDEALGIDLYRDGLEIYTTLDSRLQKLAEAAVYDVVQANQALFSERILSDPDLFRSIADTSRHPADSIRMMLEGKVPVADDLKKQLLVQTAFMAIDPTTGQIRAMVGGRPDYHDQFNRAVQAKRQPGSAFKPIVYTAAVDNGYPVTTQLLNQPVVVNVRGPSGWEKWSPVNYDGTTGGLTTLRDGLRQSLNLIAVRLVQELVPPEVVAQTATRMELTTPMRAVDAIALGTSEVYLQEATAAYGIYANRGVWCQPRALVKIVDRLGRTVKDYRSSQHEVLSEETAFLMTDLMRGVVERGTGSPSRWKYGFTRPAAGKTGTTQAWTDAWFIGFTPQLVAGVWMGIDDPQMTLGEGQDGARAALPAWATFMKAAHDTVGWGVADFPVPEGVRRLSICQVSKDLPTGICPTEEEWFIAKYSPSATCKIHREGGRFSGQEEES